jgi:DNA ligase-1
MSRDGEPDFTYYVFDIWSSEDTYFERALRLGDLIELYATRVERSRNRLKVLETHVCGSMTEILNWERIWLGEGHEGLMIRGINTLYKFGRGTPSQGQLIKVKRFTDSEAVVIGFEELMHNANEATLDNLGHTVHSSHKDNKVPMNTLGALICTMEMPGTYNGRTWDFKIGTGFDEATRKEIWDNSGDYLANVVKFKYFGGGIKDAPRFPVFLGFRSEEDMS